MEYRGKEYSVVRDTRPATWKWFDEATAENEPTKNRKRMEAAWLALAEEQDWLDGHVPPVHKKPERIEIVEARFPPTKDAAANEKHQAAVPNPSCG